MVASSKLPHLQTQVGGFSFSNKQNSNGSIQRTKNNGEVPLSRDSKRNARTISFRHSEMIASLYLGSPSTAEVSKERDTGSVPSS
jgi:hypothetical protein